MTEDFRERLETERRRFRMGDDSFEALERRRDRKRRNRRIASGVVALLIAAAGSAGAFVAFRGSGSVTPGKSPTQNPTGSVGPTGSPTPEAPGAVAPPSSAALQFIDADHGWMIGASGEILATTDGGGTWVVQLRDPRASAVEFIDPADGWALTDTGVMRTSDGGASWGMLSDEKLGSVQFVDAQLGWAISKVSEGSGDVLKTTDGGATWQRQSVQAQSICVGSGGDTVWAAGPGEGGIGLLRSGDGGTSWTYGAIYPSAGDLWIQETWTETVVCAGSDAWVQVTDGGAAGHLPYVVFKITEGGEDGTPVLQEMGTHPVGGSVPLDPDPYPGQVVAFDGMNAYVVASCPQCGGDLAVAAISRTSDGGTTWERSTIVTQTQAGQPLATSFIDHDRGWILLQALGGETRFVLATTDGGMTWSKP